MCRRESVRVRRRCRPQRHHSRPLSCAADQLLTLGRDEPALHVAVLVLEHVRLAVPGEARRRVADEAEADGDYD